MGCNVCIFNRGNFPENEFIYTDNEKENENENEKNSQDNEKENNN
jgi:hypothetical protein